MTNQIAFAPEKPPIIIRYCIYARKSMEAEERQALSIESQLSEMKVIADRDGLQVVCVKTEAHSAKSSGQRPVFKEMIEGLKQGTYNGILTWNADRLSRNAGDLGHLVDIMDKGLLLEIRTFGQTFSNSPSDKFLLMILCSQAKLENDNKAINVQRGLRARVESGLWPCVAPMGYLNPKLKDKLCEKELDPVRAPIIRRIFEKAAYEDQSTHQILRWLHSIDFRSPGGNLLNLSSVQAILHRHFYYGYFEFPAKSGKWYKGKHKRIITKQIFMDAKEQIEKRRVKKKYAKLRESPFAFLRMIRCGTCSSGITAVEKTRRNRINKRERQYRYYVCSRSRNRDCREQCINETQLMSELFKVLDRVDIDLIGMREFFEVKIEEYYKLQEFITGDPISDRSKEQKDYDLRKYAKVVFDDGRIEEQREILKHLTSRLILKDKQIYLDTEPLIEPERDETHIS